MSAHSIDRAGPAAAAPRRFYVALTLFTALLVFVGFWPSFFGALLTGTVDRPVVIHVHAAIYVGWLALFVAQAAFAATGRVAAHMKLGKIGIGYGVLVIVMGLVVSFSMFAIRVRAGQLEEAQLSLLAPLVDMAVFTPFFLAAVIYRRKPELHKRFMIVATTSLLIAAVGRMAFLGSVWAILIVWNSPILLAMSYDYLKRRIVHPIYLTGITVLVVELIWRRGARSSETWADICASLARLFT